MTCVFERSLWKWHARGVKPDKSFCERSGVDQIGQQYSDPMASAEVALSDRMGSLDVCLTPNN